MIATLLPCLLLVGSFAAAPRAQKPEPAPHADAQLLLDLGSDERSMDAVRILTHRGEKGVAILVAAIRDPKFHDDQRRLAAAIYVLGRMGDTAASAAELLLDEVETADGDVLRTLYWALGEIGAKAQANGMNVLGRLQGRVPTAVEVQSEWVYARERIALGTTIDERKVVDLLKAEARDYISVSAVGAYLARLEPGSAVPREQLRAAWRRSEEVARRWGGGYQRVAMELARAVAVHLPRTPDATAACALLIYHFDAEVRLQAVMQLGQSPGSEVDMAVHALQVSLTDGSVQVRREAVTALGMIGPKAQDALPALEQLTGDSDAQIRGRAEAAARAIRGRGR